MMCRDDSLTIVVSRYQVTVGADEAVHTHVKVTPEAVCWMLGFWVKTGAFFPPAGASVEERRRGTTQLSNPKG